MTDLGVHNTRACKPWNSEGGMKQLNLVHSDIVHCHEELMEFKSNFHWGSWKRSGSWALEFWVRGVHMRVRIQVWVQSSQIYKFKAPFILCIHPCLGKNQSRRLCFSLGCHFAGKLVGIGDKWYDRQFRGFCWSLSTAWQTWLFHHCFRVTKLPTT